MKEGCNVTTTKNYNLLKPNVTEKYNINIQNQNMDIIDSALNEIANQQTSTIESIKTQDIQNLFN